jgi:hypothetical protein
MYCNQKLVTPKPTKVSTQLQSVLVTYTWDRNETAYTLVEHI